MYYVHRVKSFNALTKLTANLTVTDFTNQTASYERGVVVFDLQVPDPGTAGEATLFGIDTDSSGVRDDVQRYIIARIKGFEAVLPVALNIAKYTQSLIENKDSQLMIDQLYKQRNDQYLCLISKMDSRSADVLFREIKAVSYNTKERLEVWQDISQTVTNESLNDRKGFPAVKYGELCE